MKSNCPICGTGKLVDKKGNFRFTPPDIIPGGEIVVPNTEWQECSDCNKRILSNTLLVKLDVIRHKRLALLAPEEIRNIRIRAGFSQTKMSELLSVGEKTYTRWESGKSLQNKSSDNLIRILERSPELFPQLEAQRNPERHNQIDKYIKNLGNLGAKKQLAIAMHGGEVGPTIRDTLRVCLQQIIKSKRER